MNHAGVCNFYHFQHVDREILNSHMLLESYIVLFTHHY